MLRPRSLTNAISRTTTNVTDSKSNDGIQAKCNEDTKERMEQFKLQRNVNHKKHLDGNITPGLKCTPESNVVKRFVTSTPLSANSHVFKLISKSNLGKYRITTNIS